MHTLIVTSHPDASSYTNAVAQQVIAGIESTPGHTCELADLMAEGFDPRFSQSDIDLFRQGIRSKDEAILAEQARVDRADTLVLVFPVYWWSMPALMKGWIDRVFSQEWAYIDHPEKGITKLLKRLNVQIIAIGGATQGTYERHGYDRAFHTQIEHGIFDFTGPRVIGSELLLPLDDAAAKDGLLKALEIGKNLSDPANFDRP